MIKRFLIFNLAGRHRALSLSLYPKYMTIRISITCVFFVLLSIDVSDSGSKSFILTRVQSIDDRVAWIEEYRKQHPDNVKFFGVEGNNDGDYEMFWSPKDGLDGSGVYYQIIRDKEGHILAYHVEPDDGTGDWAESETYYFDERGNTILYDYYHAVFFQAECKYLSPKSIIRTLIKKYYDSDFNVISAPTLTMQEREPFDFALCDLHPAQPAEKIARNYGALKKAAQSKYRKYIWKNLWN